MFRSLAEKFRKKAPEGPYLSDHDLRKLKSLVKNEGWEIYLGLLDRRIYLLAESLLIEDDEARLHAQRGEIRGLRNAITLVLQQVNKEEALNAERRAAERAIAIRRSDRIAATFGSPAWRA